MIDVSPLTHLAQHQPVPVDTAQPLKAVQPVESAKGAESGHARDSGEEKFARQGVPSNVFYSGDSSLQFRIDQNDDQLIVSLMDSDGKVIRQVPSEVVLRIAQRIEDIQAKGRAHIDARV